MTDYTVVYARRRTLCVLVRPDGAVEVRAPRGMAKKQIQAFVEEHAAWVGEQRDRVLERRARREENHLAPGQSLRLLGREYLLAPLPPGERPRQEQDRLLLPWGCEEEARGGLEAVCRAMAQGHILPRVRELAERWGFGYAGASVTAAKTRWGSCSPKNHLNFSLRLCYASPQAVDYVILHELAHTREHNHSPRFWQVVEGHMPDYRLRRAELRELADRLDLWGL